MSTQKAKHKIIGSVFQGHFKAILVKDVDKEEIYGKSSIIGSKEFRKGILSQVDVEKLRRFLLATEKDEHIKLKLMIEKIRRRL